MTQPQPPVVYKKTQPVIILGSITTALAVIFGGLTTVAGLQGNTTIALIAGAGTLLTAGINAGKDYFLREKVTPNVDVAAYRAAEGTIVTGPAAPGPNDVPAVVEARPEAALEEGWTAEEIGRLDS